MSVWRWLSAVAMFFVAAMAYAQPSGAGLELRLEPSRDQTKGLPSRIVARLVNVSDKDILIPQPLQDCTFWKVGGTQLSIEGPDPNQEGRNCIADAVGGAVSPAMRMKDWKRLRPGESLTFDEDVAAELSRWKGPLPPGRFVLRVRYNAPLIGRDEWAYLAKEGLGAPKEALEAKLTLVRRGGD